VKLSRADAEELLSRPGVIKNRRKAEALVHNAKEFRAIEKEHGSFARFLETLRTLSEKERQKALSKRFKQVGPETADYFLHSVGFQVATS
jgi:DNA-3-methyladenine glycosylase I